MKHTLTLFAAVSSMVMLSGCAAQNMYMAHDTSIGIKAQLSADRQKGSIALGYKRDYVAIIPKSVEQGQPAGQSDVMASMGCSRVETQGARLIGYSDAVATGAVAIELAKDVDAQSKLFDCGLLEQDSQ